MEYTFDTIIIDLDKGDDKYDLEKIEMIKVNSYMLKKLDLLRIECNKGEHYNKYRTKRFLLELEYDQIQKKIKELLNCKNVHRMNYEKLPETKYDRIINHYNYGLIQTCN